jgi:hypothetical protein
MANEDRDEKDRQRRKQNGASLSEREGEGAKEEGGQSRRRGASACLFTKDLVDPDGSFFISLSYTQTPSLSDSLSGSFSLSFSPRHSRALYLCSSKFVHSLSLKDVRY